MDSNHNNLSLQLGFDRELVWYRGKSVRFLVADVTASVAEQSREHTPLNVAVVIDASGSMEGQPLGVCPGTGIGSGVDELAREWARRVIRAVATSVEVGRLVMTGSGWIREVGVKSDPNPNLSSGGEHAMAEELQ